MSALDWLLAFLVVGWFFNAAVFAERGRTMLWATNLAMALLAGAGLLLHLGLS